MGRLVVTWFALQLWQVVDMSGGETATLDEERFYAEQQERYQQQYYGQYQRSQLASGFSDGKFRKVKSIF